MPRFRARRSGSEPVANILAPLSIEELRHLVSEVWQPAHFFLGKASTLEWQHLARENILWEIYQGHLLGPSQTRAVAIFESWNLFWADEHGQSEQPLLSLKLDTTQAQLHITRAVYRYTWEGYHAGDNVYLSREVPRWVAELVGTVHLEQFADPEELRDELISLLFQAVVGSSRLPLRSVEAPLPAFMLGKLGYFHRTKLDTEQEASPSMTSFRELLTLGLHEELCWLEKAKLLELLLRSIAAEEIGEAAELFLLQWRRLGLPGGSLPALCRTLFNDVTLVPYTDFVDQTLSFLKALVRCGGLSNEGYADFLSYLLRLHARHLTAYDLKKYHHRGANYPDALLLDRVLKTYLELVESQPELFHTTQDENATRQRQKRLRRRALRQGWLLRCSLEGLPVPEAPTSPGENDRILPPPHVRVSAEQMNEPAKRVRRLFVGEPLQVAGPQGQALMRQCLADLEHFEEFQELGMALFLDRPLGIGKAPAERDQTPLLSYEAFSRRLADHRLRYLAQDLALLTAAELAILQRRHAAASVRGLALQPMHQRQRPGAVSLQDALQVADDFLLLRSTRRTVQEFLELFDWSLLARSISLDYLDIHLPLLLVRAEAVGQESEDVLIIHDAHLVPRLKLQVDRRQGFQVRAGREYPAAGLRVLEAWKKDGSSEDPLNPAARAAPT